MPYIRFRVPTRDLFPHELLACDALVAGDFNDLREAADAIARIVGVECRIVRGRYFAFKDGQFGQCYGGWLKRKSCVDDLSWDGSMEEGDIIYLQLCRPGRINWNENKE